MDQIAYLDSAAATSAGADYKRRFLGALGVRAGQTVVDVGCGPGTDLAALADLAGPAGLIIGVDRDADMLAEARRRHADRAEIVLRDGDAHALPLAGNSTDRVRTDRVMQHLRDPALVLREAARVLRPGGIVGMAEPDWDTLAVADEDVAQSRRFARATADRVRNPTIGRELVRLSERAGLRVRSVEAIAVVFRDFGTADWILGLRRHSGPEARDWLERLEAGPTLAGFTLYLVTAQK
jgi:ubiquinone/menaquinone biosynthesis C-methylase UbiE